MGTGTGTGTAATTMDAEAGGTTTSGTLSSQGPIAALVGGLIGLAIEKHGERKAAREAAVEVEAEVEQQEEQEVGRRQTTTRHVEVVDDSSSSENEAEGLDDADARCRE